MDYKINAILSDEEKILALLRSLNVRIRKAEQERDCAVRRLQQLKSILDNYASDPPGADDHKRIPSHLEHCNAAPHDLLAETTIRHESSENREYDSGLASSLTVGPGTGPGPGPKSEPRLGPGPETDGEKFGRSSVSSEEETSWSLKFAATQNDPVVRTPLSIVNRKAFLPNAGTRGSVCIAKPCVTPRHVAVETAAPTTNQPVEQASDPNSDKLGFGCVKSGDAILRNRSSESRTEAPTMRESIPHSSAMLTEALPVTRSILRSLAMPPATYGVGDQLTEACATHQECRVASNSQSPKRRSSLVSSLNTAATHASQHRLPQLLQNRWSNLKPFTSDPPITHAPGVARLTALSDPDVCQCQSRSRQTTAVAELRCDTIPEETYLTEPMQPQVPFRCNEQLTKRSSTGVMSRTWLRQLIARLEELSETYQPHHLNPSPVVRFNCDSDYPVRSRTRASSCSALRGQSAFSTQRCASRRSSSPPSSASPDSPKMYPTPRSRVATRPNQLHSKKVFRPDFPVFVPMDHASRRRSKKTKSNAHEQSNASLRPEGNRVILPTKVRKTPTIIKRSPSITRTPSVLNVGMQTTPHVLPDIESRPRSSPRIVILDPDGAPQESKCSSPIRIHRVLDAPMAKTIPRLSWK